MHEIRRKKRNTAQILLIGGSAGSLSPIKQLLSALPKKYCLPVVLLIHLGEGDESLIMEGLCRHSHLPIEVAGDKQVLKSGTVYLAPGDYHLLIEKDAHFALSVDKKEHYCRPAIDVLFISALACYGGQCAAILFSGSNQDGAEGIYQISKAGGQVWVQDPQEAEYSNMPLAAINKSAACYVLNTSHIISDVSSLVLSERIVN